MPGRGVTSRQRPRWIGTHRGDRRIVRVVLGVALGPAVILALFEAVSSVASVANDAGRPWQDSMPLVARAQGVDPRSLERLAKLIPPGATYAMDFSPRLAGTDYGQAFSALLRGELLPRVQVPRSSAHWVIVWGEPVLRGRQVRIAGLVHAGDPPVAVLHRG